MANTLKELAATAQLVSQTALEQALIQLKTYIDTQDTAGSSAATAAIEAVDAKLDALIGGEQGDVDKVINTFNEIKAFLAGYDEDDTLKSLLDAVNTAISTEQTRAEAAEAALSGRITTLENVAIMTANQAEALFNGVFYPSNNNGGGE